MCEFRMSHLICENSLEGLFETKVHNAARLLMDCQVENADKRFEINNIRRNHFRLFITSSKATLSFLAA